jgi:ubiquinone/menaquinone biosynthesis C-methylase UbiE
MREALSPSELIDVYDRAATRYDVQHRFLTAGSDERGRRLLVGRAVKDGGDVLDCGAGTGSTALLAARRAGTRGCVTLVDASSGMLAVAKRRAVAQHLDAGMRFEIGDLLHLPFPDNRFDVVLSTYSLCPVLDPARGALEILRVTRPGGLIGIAHSVEPRNPTVRWLADRVEAVVWRLPAISLGCRSIAVRPVLEDAGARLVFETRIGVPLWPFAVFVLEKPES